VYSVQSTRVEIGFKLLDWDNRVKIVEIIYNSLDFSSLAFFPSMMKVSMVTLLYRQIGCKEIRSMFGNLMTSSNVDSNDSEKRKFLVVVLYGLDS